MRDWLAFSALSCCFLSLPAGAATLVEFSDGDSVQKVWIEGKRLRIESAGDPNAYSIFDLSSGRLYGLSRQQHQIVEYDLSAADAGATEAATRTTEIEFEDHGHGPRLTGYKTRRYVLKGDGTVCGEFFLSQEALADAGMEDALGSLRRITAGAHGSGNGYDACDQAGAYVIGAYLKLGLPMRQLGADGKLVQEIVGIRQNAPLPPGGTELPGDYQRISMQDYVRQVLQRQ